MNEKMSLVTHSLKGKTFSHSKTNQILLINPVQVNVHIKSKISFEIFGEMSVYRENLILVMKTVHY